MLWEPIVAAVKGFGDTLVNVIQEFHLAPEVEAKLRQAALEAQFATTRQLYAMEDADRADARQREIKTSDATTKRLAYISVVGFFVVLGVQFGFAFTGHPIATEVQRTLDISTGVLFAMVLAVKDYYFGTSHSSSKKDAVIDRVVNHNA